MFAFYLFSVSAVGLLVFYVSASGALSHLVQLQLGTGLRTTEHLLSGLGFAVSAGLIWLLHWRALLQRRRSMGDGLRGLWLVYLLTLSFSLAMTAMTQGATLVEQGGELLMRLEGAGAWQLVAAAAKLLLTGGLWAHHLQVFYVEAKQDMASAKKSKKAS